MTDTGRHRFIVCYDIREPRRLRSTHDAMLGFGEPLQYSVFICDLSKTERLLMEDALRRIVRLPEDYVHVIDLGPAAGRASRRIRTLGGAAPAAPRRPRVV